MRAGGLELSIRPGPAPCTQKQLPSLSGGRQSLCHQERRRAKAAQARGCDGGGHGDRVGKGVLLLTRAPPSPAGPGSWGAAGHVALGDLPWMWTYP